MGDLTVMRQSHLPCGCITRWDIVSRRTVTIKQCAEHDEGEIEE